MNKTIPLIIVGVAVLLSIIMHFKVFTLPIQGKDTWRQSKTGWNIRFFVREDANIFNPRRAFINEENNIERYELPLMQWPVAMIEKIFGEHILIERLYVFLISLLTLLAVFKLSNLLTSDTVTAALATFCFTFLPTFFYNATNIMPDLLALCFGMYYVLFFFRHLKHNRSKDLIWSAVFIALAGLAKLPFILLGIFSLIQAIRLLRFSKEYRTTPLLTYIGTYTLALLPVIAWYAIAIPDWKGNNIATGIAGKFVGWPLYLSFLENQVFNIFPTEILNIPTLFLLLTGVAVIWATRKLFFTSRAFLFIPWLLLTLYFLYVLNVIREGHDYYLMPFYPVFLLAIVSGIHTLLYNAKPFRRLLIMLLILMPVTCWWRVHPYWNIAYAYMNPSFFECREQFKTIGNNRETAIVINDESLAVFPYVIDKRSFIFWNDHLPVLWMKDIIKNKRASYLYSDSRAIEGQEGFNEVIDTMLLECGSVKVWKLKNPEEIRLE